ncbi:MAG: cobalamin-dependent protein, partial [Candidatus Omnitrophota bacterium]|nr:cobalamin-dependent protein [Candidatus Omnitrophota bacterium]
MKITLISMGAENLGVEYLSIVLKKAGHQVSLVFDPALFSSEVFFEGKGNKVLSKIFNRKKKMLEEIKLLDPGLIGFSVLTSNYQWSLDIAKSIKEFFDIPIVFGGLHSTIVPERVIKNKCVDMIVVGEGEYALLDIADNLETNKRNYHLNNVWFKDNGKIIQNGLRPLVNDLDSLPFPDKGLFYQKVPPYQHEYTIMASRGCSFNCS